MNDMILDLLKRMYNNGQRTFFSSVLPCHIQKPFANNDKEKRKQGSQKVVLIAHFLVVIAQHFFECVCVCKKVLCFSFVLNLTCIDCP